MSQNKPHSQTASGPRRSVRVSLAEIIGCLQDCTDDDQTVVAAVMELMRQGRLRRLANPAPIRVDKAA